MTEKTFFILSFSLSLFHTHTHTHTHTHAPEKTDPLQHTTHCYDQTISPLCAFSRIHFPPPHRSFVAGFPHLHLLPAPAHLGIRHARRGAAAERSLDGRRADVNAQRLHHARQTQRAPKCGSPPLAMRYMCTMLCGRQGQGLKGARQPGNGQKDATQAGTREKDARANKNKRRQCLKRTTTRTTTTTTRASRTTQRCGGRCTVGRL